MGSLISAILVVNNLRDIDTDRGAGKRTLAVRIGREATRWEYLLLLVVAYLTPVAIAMAGMRSWSVLLALTTIPLGALLVRQVWTLQGRSLNTVLAGTARLCLWFAVAFAAGLVLS